MRTYSVPGISCDHCKAAIEGEVGKLEGVARVEVDVDARSVTVDGTAPDDAIRAAIDDAGYEVAPTWDQLAAVGNWQLWAPSCSRWLPVGHPRGRGQPGSAVARSALDSMKNAPIVAASDAKTTTA
jgi:copper chaperone